MAIVVLGNAILKALAPGNIVAMAWETAQWPLVLALILLAFAITYYFAPALTIRQWHWITPGAIIGVLLWLAVSSGLRIYLHFFNTYNAAYGSLGAVIVLLLWFYLSGIAVLSGAVLNGVLQSLAAPMRVPQEKEHISSRVA